MYWEVLFVFFFLTTANMASGFLVGGILNSNFFPLKWFSYEFIFSLPCLNHNIVVILVTYLDCYKSDMLILRFSSCFVPSVRSN